MGSIGELKESYGEDGEQKVSCREYWGAQRELWGVLGSSKKVAESIGELQVICGESM